MRLTKLKVTVGLLSFILWCAVPFCLTAQKSPKIQTTGIWLPETTKIDGKLSEWVNGLSANNKSNHLQYTLANNDKYLYLAVKSADKVTIGKIMAGGVGLKLKFSGQKLNSSTIVYPLNNLKYQKNNLAYLDTVKIKDMIAEAKELKVLNIGSVPDTLLSIYNSNDIRSSLNYKNGELVYELMMPIKLLAINENLKFNYTIILAGTSEIAKMNNQLNSAPPPPPGLAPGRSPSSPAGMVVEIGEATDFSGEYTLYKK